MIGLRGSAYLFIIIVTIGLAVTGSKGMEAKIGDYPWQAALLIKSSVLQSAVIISQEHVLTCASLVYRYERKRHSHKLSVVVGKTQVIGRKADYQVGAIIIHPNYTLDNTSPQNLAVLKLKTKIEFTETIRPVQLPTSNISPGTVVDVLEWEVRGYDATSRNQLMKNRAPIADNTACNRVIHQQYPSSVIYNVNDNQICTMGLRNAGNMGSSMLLGNVLVGIKSWCLYCTFNSPFVFTNVYLYSDWIREVIKINGSVIDG